MRALDYITSEQFIHDDLLQKGQAAVDKLYDIWRKEGHIDASLLTWPAETITDDQGQRIEGVCALTLPKARELRGKAIRAMVERTKAYGLLLVESLEDKVQVLLETPRGTRCWTMPIHRSGDVNILGDATITNDRENVGLLWSPKKAVS